MGTYNLELWGAWRAVPASLSEHGLQEQFRFIGERRYRKENRRLEMEKHLRYHSAPRINLQASAGSGEDGAEMIYFKQQISGCLLLKFHSLYGLMGLQVHNVVEMTWHVFHSASPLHRYMVRVCCANIAQGLLLSSSEQLRD